MIKELIDKYNLNLIKIVDHFYIRELLPENPVVIDAGALEAELAYDILINFPKSSIYIIEANYKLYIDLKSRFTKHKNMYIYSAALVGDNNQNKTLELVTYKNKLGWGTVSKNMQNKHMKYIQKEQKTKIISKEKVKTISIEDLKINRIDLLKLDIEGMEEEVFTDMNEKRLKSISQITMEIHNVCNEKKIVNILENSGFEVIKPIPGELFAVNKRVMEEYEKINSN